MSAPSAHTPLYWHSAAAEHRERGELELARLCEMGEASARYREHLATERQQTLTTTTTEPKPTPEAK